MKMATAMFSETLDNFQHSARLIPESNEVHVVKFDTNVEKFGHLVLKMTCRRALYVQNLSILLNRKWNIFLAIRYKGMSGHDA
jgi:hypothetical protein